MKKIEHIGIAVANAESSIKLFNALFNKEPYKIEKSTFRRRKYLFL